MTRIWTHANTVVPRALLRRSGNEGAANNSTAKTWEINVVKIALDNTAGSSLQILTTQG